MTLVDKSNVGENMVPPNCWVSALRNLPRLAPLFRVHPFGSQPQGFETHAERTSWKSLEACHHQFKFSSWLMSSWSLCDSATGESGLSATPRNSWCSLPPSPEAEESSTSQHHLANENSWPRLLEDVKFAHRRWSRWNYHFRSGQNKLSP